MWINIDICQECECEHEQSEPEQGLPGQSLLLGAWGRDYKCVNCSLIREVIKEEILLLLHLNIGKFIKIFTQDGFP